MSVRESDQQNVSMTRVNHVRCVSHFHIVSPPHLFAISLFFSIFAFCFHPCSLTNHTDASRAAKDDLERKKNQQLALKDAEISEHKQKMEDMALEFSQMLKVYTHLAPSVVSVSGCLRSVLRVCIVDVWFRSLPFPFLLFSSLSLLLTSSPPFSPPKHTLTHTLSHAHTHTHSKPWIK